MKTSKRQRFLFTPPTPLGFQEISETIELFPQAALLLKMDTGDILYGNAKATALSAFTRDELRQIRLNRLFPNSGRRDLLALRPGDAFTELLLATRNLEYIPVEAALHHLYGR